MSTLSTSASSVPSVEEEDKLTRLRKENERLSKELGSAQNEILNLKQRIGALTVGLTDSKDSSPKSNVEPPREEPQVAAGPAPLPIPPPGCSIRQAAFAFRGKPCVFIKGDIDRFDESVLTELRKYYHLIVQDPDMDKYREDWDDDDDSSPYYEDEVDLAFRLTD